jgi:hypothetical protein
MNPLQTKQSILGALSGFGSKPLAAAATALFECLGYHERELCLKWVDTSVMEKCQHARE